MSEVKTICLLFFAFFSVGVGATLMHQSIADNDINVFPLILGESLSCKHEAACHRLVDEYQTQNLSDVAEKMYIKAFRLGFNDQPMQAEEAAECAAHLNLGHHGWKIE